MIDDNNKGKKQHFILGIVRLDFGDGGEQS